MSINEERNLDLFALIPARGGSKGLPGKNLMEIQGISLVARAILLARKVRTIKNVILSTDDRNIMQEGKRAGCDILLKRPEELSTSRAPMRYVIQHAVQWIKDNLKQDEKIFGLVVLQPTSPMRKLKHIVGAIELFKRHVGEGKSISGVISVSPVPDYLYPHRTFKLIGNSNYPQGGGLFRNRDESQEVPQERYYYRNGAVVILKSDCLTALNEMDPPVIPYIIDEQLVSIDSMIDLLSAEYSGRLEPDRDSVQWEKN